MIVETGRYNVTVYVPEAEVKELCADPGAAEAWSWVVQEGADQELIDAGGDQAGPWDWHTVPMDPGVVVHGAVDARQVGG